jgi:hypothetical protein
MASTFQRRLHSGAAYFGLFTARNVVRGHDINGKRFYKQLNPVESICGAAKPLIFLFPVEHERHPSVYPAHEVVRLRRNIVKDTSTLPFRFVHVSHQPGKGAGFAGISGGRNTVSWTSCCLPLIESFHRDQTAGDYSRAARIQH